ncbi:hypothetical protein [Thermotoga sp.]|nr:hypothetical protein [Thermotoga sp.]MCD6550683.1 hypothetical protein [Thermotoga sp.]
MTLPEEFYRTLARILLETPKTREILMKISQERSEERESEDVPSQAGRDD